MSVKKYEVLLKAVELGSLTHAAEVMGLTQSGVSHIVGSIESELGVRLLNRGRSRAVLTPEGELLLPAIRGIVHSAEQLRQLSAAINGLSCGTVRIGAFTSVAVHWLPGMLKTFSAQYPSVEIELLSGDYHDIACWVSSGEVDIAFTAYPEELSCRCIPLREDRLLAVLPADHPLAHAGVYPLSRAADEPFISLLKESDHDARRALESAGITPRVKYYTKDDYAIIAMVECGLGMSIMPELLLRGQSRQIAVLPLDPPVTRVINLAIPDPAGGSPAARAFASHAAAWLEENEPRRP